MSRIAIKFPNVDSSKFFRTLNQRVNSYFKENNLKKTGNWRLYIKTIIMFSMMLVPYVLIITLPMSQWMQFLLVILAGVGMAGIGMNVMHDGNHGSFSSKKWVNSIMGGSIYILAGNVYNWQVQHNVLHHTYTNIQGYDEDIDAGRIIRFSKNADWQKMHKYQKYYSIFLYGLLTINWVITTDFKQSSRYLKRGLSYGKFPDITKHWTGLVIAKIVYVIIWIVIPMIVLSLAWWKIMLGFFVMHYVAGLILSLTFQLAHVMPDTDMPVPDKDGNMQNAWAVHQLLTTANFAPKNIVVGWFTGGLNRQIEHHLFSNISHIHYKKLAKIVKETAEEFQLPYHEYKTTRRAISSHFQQLAALGKKPAMA